MSEKQEHLDCSTLEQEQMHNQKHKTKIKPEEELSEIKSEQLEKFFTFSEVAFSLLFSTLMAILLYNYFGFSLKKRFSLIVRWSTTVVVWGWLMVLTLYGVDWVSRRWKKKAHLVLQILLSLVLGAGLVYFLIRLF